VEREGERGREGGEVGLARSVYMEMHTQKKGRYASTRKSRVRMQRHARGRTGCTHQKTRTMTYSNKQYASKRTNVYVFLYTQKSVHKICRKKTYIKCK
jgi:hypothetical protein